MGDEAIFEQWKQQGLGHATQADHPEGLRGKGGGR